MDEHRLVSSKVVIDSSRDARVLDYLVSIVGIKAINEACDRLPGGRRAYVSNIARALDITVPASLAETPRAEGAARFADIKDLLNKSIIKR